MPTIKHNPSELFPQYRAYSHGVEIRGDARLLFISGLNGYESDGKTMPESFDEQAELISGVGKSSLTFGRDTPAAQPATAKAGWSSATA
jgi:hypothetical protein